MKILITGGCGFKGSVLIPKLLKEGHEITNIDIEWFGNYLKPNNNLNSIKRDIRNIEDIAFDDFDAIQTEVSIID